PALSRLVPHGEREKKSRSSNSDSWVFVEAMPVLTVVTMLQGQREEFVPLLFAALQRAAALLDPLRFFNQFTPFSFQPFGMRSFALAVEIFFAINPRLQTDRC